MHRRFSRHVIVSAMLAAMVSLGVSAQPRPAPAAPIRLRAATFTPARGERPAIPDALTLRSVPAGRRGYYIVQFDGPITDAEKSSLTAAGAEVLEYIPEFALKVRMTPGAAADVARVPRVAWVGVFEPAFKLPPDVVRGPALAPYTVRIERGASADAAAAAVRATGARVVDRSAALLTVLADAAQLEAIARVLDVAAIDTYQVHRKHNEFGGGVIGAGLAAAAGYDGSTQTIAISDTGIGGGTAATAHRDLPAGRIADIFNWPGVPSACFQTVVSDGPVDVDTGHGTHVATSALGGGDANGIGRGTAPASRLVFQAIEDFATPSFFCQFLLGLTPGYYLTGIPADIGQLFQQAYDAGARVHSNSWGSAAGGAYTADSANTDAFVWAHRDLAVTISAGNAGVDGNRDGLVDGGSLNAPATAKNVITVGASEGDRGANYPCDAALPPGTCGANGGENVINSYGSAFGAAFPVNPLKDDGTAGNAEQMAAFSSRGPTSDGRIKPDVVAPGTWILSGYADQFQQHYDPSPNPQTGRYQYDGWGDPRDDQYKYMGGTSMSAPLAAGGAAVVRDYYQKAHAHAASAALVKATLVNTAVDLLDENNDGIDDNAHPIPNIHEGWGRVDLGPATDGSREFQDESIALATGDVSARSMLVDNSLRPLRVTLAWTDAPSTTTAAVHLVNDLDLELHAPDGTVYFGNVFLGGWSVTGGGADRVNNLENVYVAAPAAGEWTVVVRGYNVPQGPQPFALVTGRDAALVLQLPRVSVQATSPSASEAGLTAGAFTLFRSGDLSGALSVEYQVSGSATAGADYVALPGAVTFAPGLAEAIVLLEPLDDALVEPNETVVLTITAGSGYGLRAPTSATIDVISDDQPGDLVVSAMSAPALAAAGSAVVVTDTTKNQGSFPTPSSETGFYLSKNSVLDSTDTYLGSRAVPALPSLTTHTASTELTLPLDAAGSYYLIAKADWNVSVPETSESNNTRSSSSVKVGPDLVVVALTVPTTAAPGGSISVSDTTRNDGLQSAGASTTAFYLSVNSTWDAADVRLGSRPIAPLAAAVADAGATIVTIPAGTSAGSYYVIARADDEGRVAEAVETNNTRHAPTVKIGADLVVSAVSAPATAAPGGAIAVSDTTRNQGAAGADAFTTAFYLSTNSTLGTGDLRLGERLIAELGEGLSSSATTSVVIPAGTVPGTYYLIANADDGNQVAEPVESNNSRVAATALKVGADLFVVSVSATSLTGAGLPITITDTVKNTGGAPAVATEAAFYLSSNTSLDAADVELVRRPVAALGAGSSDSGSVVATIPADTPVGSYYVIALVDAANEVAEASEANNTYRSGLVRIGPDLTITALSAPTAAAAGSTINVTDTTKNVGGAVAPASLNGYYLSTNSALDAADLALTTRAVAVLSAGASQTVVTTVVIPTAVPAGTYYLIAQANDAAAVEETSTSNNIRRVTVKITAP